MNRRSVAVLLGLAVIVTAIVFGVIFRLDSENSTSSISDDVLIAKTKVLPEVQTFLTKYPNATVHVERGSDTLVQYTIYKSTLEGHQIDPSNVTASRSDSEVYMWIFLGSQSLGIQQISLLCSGGAVIYDQNDTGWTREKHFQINSGIVSYLEHGKEEECFT